MARVLSSGSTLRPYEDEDELEPCSHSFERRSAGVRRAPGRRSSSAGSTWRTRSGARTCWWPRPTAASSACGRSCAGVSSRATSACARCARSIPPRIPISRAGGSSRVDPPSARRPRDQADLIFNTPNEKSLPGYLKMGWTVVGHVPIYVRVRRPVRFVTPGAVLETAIASRLRCCLGSQALSAGEVLGDPGVEELLRAAERYEGIATQRSRSIYAGATLTRRSSTTGRDRARGREGAVPRDLPRPPARRPGRGHRVGAHRAPGDSRRSAARSSRASATHRHPITSHVRSRPSRARWSRRVAPRSCGFRVG